MELLDRETAASPAPHGASALSARDLTKRFGTKLAVEGLTLDVVAGEVLGLLGPNGAGKTTTVRMLSGLIAPTSGTAWVGGLEIGHEDMRIRRRVGLLTETPGLYENLSAFENLLFFARLFELKDARGQVEKYLRLLGLWELRDAVAGTFSKGMKQKLAIARALIHEPDVLFLDEPTSGLDPEMRQIVCDFIERLRREGRTIVLCTHNLDEAERLCDRVAVINTRLVALDRPAALRASLFGRCTVVTLARPFAAAVDAVRGFDYVREVVVEGTDLLVTLDDPDARNPEIVRALVAAGAEVRYVAERKQSLQDVYLAIVRRGETA